ncbi:DNRLRE domain-containing protein [Actinoplanes sp. NPDC051851]|uniref:DNRLRE domain-containing protein n=1 Tax=Actinoplanes sp. NPDC051851 TaxID=3154753 RepID=UPI003416BA88
MTVPRLLRPFVRTRTRRVCTMGLLVAALVAALLPGWPLHSGPRTRAVAVPPAATDRDDTSDALAEARTTGTDVLIASATTATSLSWAQPNGELRAEIHASPQRTRNAQGAWTPIDTTLNRVPGGAGLTVAPAAAAAPLRLADGTGERDDTGETVLAEMATGGHTVTYTWPGALPEPVLDGSRALYPEVLPGVDLLVVALRSGGLGQLLIVKTRAAAATPALASLRYGLRSTTAVFRRDAATGGVLIVDPATGTEVGSVPTPFAWDSAGRGVTDTAVATGTDVLALSGLDGAAPGARNEAIPTGLDGSGTGRAVLRLDVAATGLLTDPGTTFPLFVDPTLYAGEKAWTFVSKAHPNSNFINGTNYNKGTSDARVGYEKDSGVTARSFWRMRFDKTIHDATITDAFFKVENTYSWSCTKMDYKMYLTGAISSATTWKSQPEWTKLQDTQSFAHGYDSSCGDEYVKFDVQTAAEAAADDSATTVTLGMRAVDEGDTNGWRKFDADSAELTVKYYHAPDEPTSGKSAPGGACSAGGTGLTVAKSSIILSAYGSDPDGDLKYLRFRFWKTGGAVTIDRQITPASDTGKGSTTIDSSNLVDKTTYSWDVQSVDADGHASTFYPPGTDPCRLTVDASAPPAPEITSDVFKEMTPDGATWSTVKFGQTGAVTFYADGAATFAYAFEGVGYSAQLKATGGSLTIADLAPQHAGPTYLTVYAYDSAGNKSPRSDYGFYVPPRDTADAPGDTGGDGIADLLLIDASGNLRNYAGNVDGEIYTWLAASYDSEGTLNPENAKHFYSAASGALPALITKYDDAYPGDGLTDLFTRTPDGGFFLYPGDGYGSFNVDERLRVMLPSTAPDPSTWEKIKAVGDIDGDKRPDLAVQAGTAFWVLSGYTGAGFQAATLMEGASWKLGTSREVLSIDDINLDGTPDLLWRSMSSGKLYVRQGIAGSVSGSVSLDSLKYAANSATGADIAYGTGWGASTISAIVSIPDVSGDGVPDMWVRYASDGQIRVYHPSTTATGDAVKVVLGANWSEVKTFG